MAIHILYAPVVLERADLEVGRVQHGRVSFVAGIAPLSRG
jgi:hypothetical protein